MTLQEPRGRYDFCIVDPVFIEAAKGAAGLLQAAISGAREYREWREGKREEIDLATDPRGHRSPLGSRDDGTLTATPTGLLTRQTRWSLLHGQLAPESDLAAHRFSEQDPTLVVLWDVCDDPQLQSVVFSGELGQEFDIELPEGAYSITALAFDDRRDEVRGVTPTTPVYLPGDGEYELTLGVEVMFYEDEDGDVFYVDEDGDDVYVDQDTGERLFYIDRETREVREFDDDDLDQEPVRPGRGREHFVRELENRGFWLGAGATHIYYQGEDYAGEKPRVVIRDMRIRLEKQNKKTYRYELWRSYRLGEETDLALSAIDDPRNHFLVSR